MTFSNDENLQRDGLMGWNGSSDTSSQVRLSFSSKEDAINYVKEKGLEFEVIEPKKRKIQAKSYASNFNYKPVSNWGISLEYGPVAQLDRATDF